MGDVAGKETRVVRRGGGRGQQKFRPCVTWLSPCERSVLKFASSGRELSTQKVVHFSMPTSCEGTAETARGGLTSGKNETQFVIDKNISDLLDPRYRSAPYELGNEDERGQARTVVQLLSP